MEKTYLNFLRMAELYEGEGDNNELVREYKRTKDPIYLAEIFCRYYPYIQKTAARYFNLTEQDKASFAVEELHKAMLDFEEDRNCQIQTVYITYLNNRLRAETQAMNLQKRKANNNCDSFEQTAVSILKGYRDNELDVIEIQTALEQSEILTENELEYCKIIIGSDNVRDSDVAKELNISPSAVFQIKKRLSKKLDLINLLPC